MKEGMKEEGIKDDAGIKDEGAKEAVKDSSKQKIAFLDKGSKETKIFAERLKTLGPVDNLEDYVQSDWWRHIFNSYYLKTDSDVVSDYEITRKEVDVYIDIFNIDKASKLLDLCCGQGRHCFEFFEKGFTNVNGLDRSHYLITRAKKTVRSRGLPINFREGDARKLPYPDCSFDCVTILGNSFGYFETVNDDLKVLKEVFRVLRPSGKVLIDVADGEYLKKNYSPRSWEWIDKNYFVCRERSLSCDLGRLISREVISHVSRGIIVDQFYAERLYSQEDLTRLLERVGFKNIDFHGNFRPESKRNQDLGMMERRIVLTAAVQKEWQYKFITVKSKSKNVAVILGDPNKKDIVKPSAVFDDDDFYTINKLKSTLADLEGYRFTHFNNHDLLIHDLTKHKNEFDYVFNLCDEGFSNVPREELHVPALLEMIRIPFTGAGPQCLAYCYDKSLVRGIANEMQIAVPKAFFIRPEDNIYELLFDFPLLIKPNFGDSSVGITQRSYATNVEQVVNAVEEIRERLGSDNPILVEEFLEGKDLSVGIIGNPPEQYCILPIIEEDYSVLPVGLPKICGYEAKWLPDSPYWKVSSILADIPESTEKYIENCCLKLFSRLECRDYCRFDWRLDKDGNPKLLEVNPNPGWCWDGHLARMAQYNNMSYADMIREILKAAEQRLKI